MAVRVKFRRRSFGEETAAETRFNKRSVASANATRHSVHATMVNAKKTRASLKQLSEGKLRRAASEYKAAGSAGRQSLNSFRDAARSLIRGDFSRAGRSAFSGAKSALRAIDRVEDGNAVVRPVARNATNTARSARAVYRRGRNTIKNAQRAADVRSQATGGRAASDASKA